MYLKSQGEPFLILLYIISYSLFLCHGVHWFLKGVLVNINIEYKDNQNLNRAI